MPRPPRSTRRSTADWDAASYHQVARPHAVWGANVLERLELRGDEVVLDAGCGSGRVTAQLLERLQDGSVIATDRSPAMLAEARAALRAYRERVTFVQADLLEIDRVLSHPVDVVFSTATFHWIADHARLFAALHRVLKPSGRLIAQFGGGDNLAHFMRATDAVALHEPFASALRGQQLWRFFYQPEQTQARLRAAGFTRAEAWLEPSPQTFEDRQRLSAFCRTVVLNPHLTALPEQLREAFLSDVVDAIAERQGSLTLDYVRLNVAALA
jgi:trans-aconitate 2-methyltransferase